MKMYEVGGCVRDEILGTPSKDIDFSVVLTEEDMSGHSPYATMVLFLEQMGIKIIRDKEEVPVGAEFLTVRGIAPKGDERVGMLSKQLVNYPGRALDFVLARKERDYSDGRRPDFVEVGTLADDLARRDFTMNAIAKDEDGNYIDPYNGREDIANCVIRAVGDPYQRLYEDALRAVRAIRFAVTKGFSIDPELEKALDDREICERIKYKISDERIQIELSKMFRFNTIDSLYELSKRNRLTTAMFNGDVSLDATMKTKGRGK